LHRAVVRVRVAKSKERRAHRIGAHRHHGARILAPQRHAAERQQLQRSLKRHVAPIQVLRVSEQRRNRAHQHHGHHGTAHRSSQQQQ
jgi:hypothetical protein